jgi:hypothetical protein
MSDEPAWIDGKHHPEPSVDHPYFTRPGHASRCDNEPQDDVPEPIDLARGDSSMQRLIDFIGSLKKERCYMRKLAFMRIIGRDNRSFAELAKEVGVSKSTFRLEYWRVHELLTGA